MLGVDVSKASLSCALYDRTTERFPWEHSYPNTLPGIQQLLARAPADVPLVVEPTGRYGLLLVEVATAAGRTVLLAPPRKAQAYLRSLSDRAKTDRIDARGLGMFGATRPRTKALRPYPMKQEHVAQLEQLLTARRGLTNALVQLEQQRQELPYAAAALEAAITALREQRQALNAEIGRLAHDPRKFPAAVRLQEIPGVGPVISAALAARLTSHDFAHGDQFVAYVGLDVGVVQSGKRKGQRGLTKQGDAELRRLLYLAARANVRTPTSPFKLQYDRELAKGMSKTAALNAVARKLARVSWSLVKHEGKYDASRVHQSATPRRTDGDHSDKHEKKGT